MGQLFMEPNSPTALTEIARVLCLLLAVSCALIAAAAYWRRHRASAPANATRSVTKSPPAGIVYRDAPTVRVTDSQRVDRLRKIARLQVGEFLDVLETRLNTTPRFRITLKALTQHNGAEAAQIVVDFGGAAVSCGPLVQEIAFNEFIIARALRDEHRSTVFHYHENGDTLDFMRIKVRSIDVQSNAAELDVMQVSGRWPTGS